MKSSKVPRSIRPVSYTHLDVYKRQELAKDFFKSTFAGSTELYDDLISKGALSTWAPAAESDIYNQDVAFFGNDAVYAKIVDFATRTPSNITGPFYYDARDAIGVALSNICLLYTSRCV